MRFATAAVFTTICLGLAQGPSAARDAAPAPASDCMARLEALGAIFSPAATPPSLPACELEQPITLRAVRGLPGSPGMSFAGVPLLACSMAERLSAFLLDVASPAAGQMFGSPVVQVDIGPGFACRPRNNQPGARISSHGRGLAADIASIRLANGRMLIMGQPADQQESEYADHLARRACVHFNTVLGIGSDATHMNNIHVDIEPRGPDGQRKLCQ